MTNCANISLSGTEIPEHGGKLNSTTIQVYVLGKADFILYGFAFVACVLGFVGNGIVIWLLGFRVKRNAFAVYILNLAVADFGVLICIVLLCLASIYLPSQGPLYDTTDYLFPLAFCTSQFLLTVISIDRCVTVFFPLWHRYRRPPHLSTTICVMIWLLNFQVCGIQFFSRIIQHFALNLLLYQFFINVVFCFPLTTISTLTLLIKVCCKPKRPKRGKLLTVILITLLVFLVLGFPFNLVFLYHYLAQPLPAYLFPYGFLCASLNSGINPLIYILVGKRERGGLRENLKAILQRLFKEEEEIPEEPVQGQSISEAIV